MRRIYLDSNATTRPSPAVIAEMRRAQETLWANPSSVHRFGQEVRAAVELAREEIASFIAAHPNEIVFTSGGTESTNLAILGIARRSSQRRVIISSPLEHSAVFEPIESLREEGFTVIHTPVDDQGRIDPEAFAALVREQAGRIALISIQWANNETGVIQPLEALAATAREIDPQARFHTDAIQWVGKMPTEVGRLGLDLLSFAPHKFHGPTGVGGLYVRRGVRLTPVQRGGPHERERRGGTENAPAILGAAVACREAAARLADGAEHRRIEALRDAMERRILAEIPETGVNGAGGKEGRIWNTSNVWFDRLEAEAILMGLSERGICASAGAACSSGSLEPSRILLAMGVPRTRAHGSIRLSLSHETTESEIDEAIEILTGVVSRLRKTLPVADR